MSGGPAPAPAGGGAGEDVLAVVIEALHEGLALFDDNAVLIRHNARFVELNAPIADLIAPGVTYFVLLHAALGRGAITAAAHERLERLEAGLGHGAPYLPPIEIDGPNDSLFEIALRPTATGGFVLTQRDITERRRLEENEREADELLRRVLDACPASVMMARMSDGEVIYRSPAAVELLGRGRRSQRYFAHRDERADFLTALLPTGRVDDMAVTALRPDGTPFPALISARQIDYRGEDAVVSSITDISKEVALRRELAEQREQIYQAEKLSALGELLAGVAHELNNPLSVVVGHALMLREESADPEVLRRIEKISDAAERCSRIVKSFLAMARQQPMRMEPLDIAETVAMAVDALRQGAARFDVRVDLDIAPDLPPVRGDGHQIAQVLINLMANADQAIRDCGTGDRVEIRARHDAGAGMIELEIADNGPGIPEAIRGRIFDPLFTTKEVGKGTGIGLAFAHRVVAAHSGQIALAPRAAPGAAFRIRLPVARPERAAPDERPEPHHPGAPAHVLVVDDEAEVAEMIRDILRRDGFVVDSTGSGEAALAMILSRPYAVILTDLNMPGLGGRGLYERLLRERPQIAARVGFVTGDTMGPQARGFLDSVGRPFLEKPIAPAELRALVERMLAGARAGAEAT